MKSSNKEASYSVPDIGASNTKSDDGRSVLSRTKHKDLVQSQKKAPSVNKTGIVRTSGNLNSLIVIKSKTNPNGTHDGIATGEGTVAPGDKQLDTGIELLKQ